MITRAEAENLFKLWAKENIPESLHYTEIKCLEYSGKKAYAAVFYHPETHFGCRSGMYVPDEHGEIGNSVIPYVDIETGEYVHLETAFA